MTICPLQTGCMTHFVFVLCPVRLKQDIAYLHNLLYVQYVSLDKETNTVEVFQFNCVLVRIL